MENFPAYNSVGGISQKLKEQIVYAKTVQKDNFGAVIEPNIFNYAKSMIDLAVESVAFSFLLRHHVQEFPKISNLPTLVLAVGEVRAHLRNTKVTLTKQMLTVLDNWEDGTFLQHGIVPAAAAIAVPEAEAVPAAPAAPAKPVVPAVVAAPDAEAVPAKRPLSSLMQEAKRKRK